MTSGTKRMKAILLLMQAILPKLSSRENLVAYIDCCLALSEFMTDKDCEELLDTFATNNVPLLMRMGEEFRVGASNLIKQE